MPGAPRHWIAVLPTLIYADSFFRLSLKCEDKWGNPSNQMDTSVDLRPSIPVDGLPEKVVFRPGQFTAVIEGLRLQQSNSLSITLHDGKDRCSPAAIPCAQGIRRHLSITGATSMVKVVKLWVPMRPVTISPSPDLAFLDMTGHQGNDFQTTATFWQHQISLLQISPAKTLYHPARL